MTEAPPEGHSLEIAFEPEAGALDLESIYGRVAPLVIEIGTGNGMFLAAEATARPECNFLGIEIAAEFFGKMKRRIEREGLKHARCIFGDAKEIFAQMLAPGSVSEVVSNFSDPWPKRRHRDRRVFRPAFLALLERSLCDGGRVVYRTDVGWYFNQTVRAFRSRPGWQVEFSGPLELGERLVTNFERKARDAGEGVWELVLTWHPSSR